MIQGINNVVISGYAGADAEAKFAQNGNAVGRIRLGVKHFGKDKDGNEKPTSWFTVKTFGKTAESCGTHVKKGTGVCVIGRLEEEHWQKDGVDKTAVVVIANEVRFNFEKDGSNQDATQPQQAAQPQQQRTQAPPQQRPANTGYRNGTPAPQAPPSAAPVQDLTDDDIPF